MFTDICGTNPDSSVTSGCRKSASPDATYKTLLGINNTQPCLTALKQTGLLDCIIQGGMVTIAPSGRTIKTNSPFFTLPGSNYT